MKSHQEENSYLRRVFYEQRICQFLEMQKGISQLSEKIKKIENRAAAQKLLIIYSIILKNV